MNINLDVDNLDFIHLDFHHLETLVHKLPNSQKYFSDEYETLYPHPKCKGCGGAVSMYSKKEIDHLNIVTGIVS